MSTHERRTRAPRPEHAREPTVNATTRPHAMPTRRGLTFIEVMIAVSILGIAAIASLELLTSSDSTGLFARRQALAAIEAERALSVSAEAVRNGGSIPDSATLSANMAGEALGGCTLRVVGRRSTVNFTIPGANPGDPPRQTPLEIQNLTAEVLDPDGQVIVTLERPVPIGAPSGG